MGRSGKILITGAAGFVGVALCRYLLSKGLPLRVVVRRGGTPLPPDLVDCLDDIVEVDNLVEGQIWDSLLEGVESVVHLAARTHCSDNAGSSSELCFCDNLDVSMALARALQKSEVHRLIFLSSIKVNGEGAWGDAHQPYKISDRPRPQGSYAVSKWRAEQELTRLCRKGGQGPVLIIIRSPLIYGEGGKGNQAWLQKWLAWGLPLPISRVRNQRSLLALDSLIGLLEFYLVNSDISSRTVLISDRRDWSTAQFFSFLARQAGVRARFFKVPICWLKIIARMSRREALFIKMFGNLCIENSADIKLLVAGRER